MKFLTFIMILILIFPILIAGCLRNNNEDDIEKEKIPIAKEGDISVNIFFDKGLFVNNSSEIFLNIEIINNRTYPIFIEENMILGHNIFILLTSPSNNTTSTTSLFSRPTTYDTSYRILHEEYFEKFNLIDSPWRSNLWNQTGVFWVQVKYVLHGYDQIETNIVLRNTVFLSNIVPLNYF